MIEKMIEECRSFFPLKIEKVSWDGTIFQMYGSSWSFTTLSSWRISSNNKVLLGCFDKESIDKAKEFVFGVIIDIVPQNNFLAIDPVFVLSNRRVIEIFSTDTYEPWTFTIDGIGTFIPTPSEPNLFID